MVAGGVSRRAARRRSLKMSSKVIPKLKTMLLQEQNYRRESNVTARLTYRCGRFQRLPGMLVVETGSGKYLLTSACNHGGFYRSLSLAQRVAWTWKQALVEAKPLSRLVCGRQFARGGSGKYCWTGSGPS